MALKICNYIAHVRVIGPGAKKQRNMSEVIKGAGTPQSFSPRLFYGLRGYGTKDQIILKLQAVWSNLMSGSIFFFQLITLSIFIGFFRIDKMVTLTTKMHHKCVIDNQTF